MSSPGKMGETGSRPTATSSERPSNLLGRPPTEILAIIALVVLAALPFLQALDFGFVNYDDPLHVSAQPPVLGGVSAEGLRWALTATPGNLWHPLTWMSYMAEVEWFGGGGDKPAVHHAGNLVLYLATVALLYLLLRQLGATLLPAMLGALLFGLHPLHAEPVAWISARKDLLSGVFILISLIAYVQSRAASYGLGARGESRRQWALVALLSFGAALLSKPSAVVLPALLVLIDWFRASGGRQGEAGHDPTLKEIVRGQLRSKAPYLLLAIAVAGAAIAIQGRGTHGDFAAGSSPARRLFDAPGQLFFYLQRTLWPVDLIFEYPRPPGKRAILYSLAGLISFAGISALAWWWRRRFPEILFGWCWMLAFLAPVIGIIYIGGSYTADRYMYLALAGPVISVTFLLGRLNLGRPAGATAYVGAGAALIVCAMISAHQTAVWRNDTSLFQHAVEVEPRHLTALGNLGSLHRMKGDEQKALEYYRAALAINPRDHIVHYNVAQIRENLGDRTGSIESCRASLAGYPNYARAHSLLGYLLDQPSHPGSYSPEEALTHLRRAWELAPERGRYATEYVRALLRRGLREEALETIDLAIGRLPASEQEAAAALEKLQKRAGEP